MERKTAQDFDQELLLIFDQYVHGAIDRRGFLDRATKFAVGGMTAGMLLDTLSPKFAEAQQVPKDDKRLKTESVEVASPNGNGKIKAYVCRPANATGKLPGDCRDPREPRPQPAHRRHRAAPGARQLHGDRARCPDAARRLSRRRREGARVVPEARSAQGARRLHCLRQLHPHAARLHRQDRRGRLLLRRRRGQHARRAAWRRPGRRRALLRRPADRRRHGQDQGRHADQLRAAPTSASTPAGRRGKPRSRPTTCATRATSTPARSTASTTTPRRATTRRRPSSPGSAPSRTSTSTCADEARALL